MNKKFSRGITTGLNEAFVVDRAMRDRLIAEHPSSGEVLKPFLRGRDVKRWEVEFSEQYLIKIESSENKKHAWSDKSLGEAEHIFQKTYSAIYNHFQNFRKGLIDRDDQGQYFWELRSCAFWRDFEHSKIISTKISIRPTFALDNTSNYLGNTLYFMTIDLTPFYILGILNSTMFHYYASRVFVGKQNGWYEVQPTALEAFPIPTTSDHAPIETLVERILTLKRSDPHANVSALEAEIDWLVYQLYGLSEEEIAIVEGKQ